MPEITNDEEAFIKEGEKIEKELGFKHFRWLSIIQWTSALWRCSD